MYPFASIFSTIPLIISPILSLYSSKILSLSNSFTLLIMTCFAEIAFNLPISNGGNISLIISPSFKSGLSFLASDNSIVLTISLLISLTPLKLSFTTNISLYNSILPKFLLIVAFTFILAPYFLFAAIAIASSSASIMESLDIPLSLATASAT